jgi:hypothetical protein
MGGSDMQHSLEFEIRDRLAAYLAGETSLHDFEDWFFPKTWDVDKLDDPALLDLVYQIKLDWAEFSISSRLVSMGRKCLCILR